MLTFLSSNSTSWIIPGTKDKNVKNIPYTVIPHIYSCNNFGIVGNAMHKIGNKCGKCTAIA
jgi:hypothetical protein